jgi:tetratricopeptide (TPR) repeat protein
MKLKYLKLMPYLIIVSLLTFTFIRFAEPVKDGDVWFHMAYGRYMLEHHTLIPDHTIYSWTHADNSTIYCAWIPEIILYLVYKMGGLSALFTLKYACIAVFFMFVMHYMRKNKALLNPLAWLMVLTGVLMSQAAMDIKPEIFSYVFMTITVWAWFMIRSSQNKGWKYCYLLPLIMLIWVNSHGGFIFGLVFLALIAMGEILNYFFSPLERLDAGTMRHFIMSMMLCLFAIFITPYGWKYPVQLFHDLILNSDAQVKEYKTVWAYQSIFHPMARGNYFIDYLIISASVLILLLWPWLKEKRLNWPLVFANIGLGWLYTQFARTTYFWGILCVFSSIALMGPEGIILRQFSNKVRKSMIVFSILACIIIAGRETYQIFCKPLFGFWINYYSPIEEAEYIRTHLRGYRLGNDYNSGTYLLWALWPETKVFMDARYFPYKRWYREYATFVYGKSDTFRDRFLKQYGCDAWCATYDFPMLSYFTTSPEWQLIHYGPSVCIFVRRDRSIPGDAVTIDESIYSVRTFQALKILDFSLSVGDIKDAVILAAHLKKSSICPKMNREVSLTLIKHGDTLSRKGYLNESIFFLNRSLMMFTIHSEEVHNKLGELYQRKGDLNKALKEYQHALDVHPIFVPAMTNTAIVYSRMGELDRSLLYLHKLVKIQPDNPNHFYNISCILSRQQKVDTALYWLELALKKGFNNWDLIMKDSDLENLRHADAYRKMILKYRKQLPENNLGSSWLHSNVYKAVGAL